MTECPICKRIEHGNVQPDMIKYCSRCLMFKAMQAEKSMTPETETTPKTKIRIRRLPKIDNSFRFQKNAEAA